MPRSRGRSAPAPQRTQTRSAHTAAAPTQQQTHYPPAAPPMQHTQQKQPGLFSQMATTAAGVAVGSAVGHTLANGVSSIFGGRSEPAQQQYEAAPVQQQQSGLAQEQNVRCDLDARNLTQCMDQNNGDMRVCQWYMDQLKSCLSASQ